MNSQHMGFGVMLSKSRPPRASTSHLHRHHVLFTLILLASLFPLPARAGGGSPDAGELSNSFISDMAPLIALFGEQVTKQFMSQSIYWYDHIIFAMGPLGIITAVVGAIRVGGPKWLRALIGRARESRGVAEMELMSSTSTDVCELWNGGVVRVMGTAKIEQLLIFPDLFEEREKEGPEAEGGKDETTGGGERTWGLYTIAAAREKGLLVRKKEFSFIKKTVCAMMAGYGLIPKITSAAAVAEEKDSSNVPGKPRKEKKCPPNISLNYESPRRTTAITQLRIVATIGVVLQLSFIIVINFCIDALVSKPGKKQKESSFSVSAKLITPIGTIALVLGMMMCSYIIERSTREVVWAVADEKSTGFYVMWVQRGQTVNDQLFDSYAMFGRDLRKSLMVSNPNQAGYLKEDDMGARGGVSQESANEQIQRAKMKDRYNGRVGESGSKVTERQVIAATVCSLCGFFLQFIGLRGMHWAATVAQLVVTLIMTGLRGWVRHVKDSRQPFAHQLPHKFELDWLATRLASCSSDDDPSAASMKSGGGKQGFGELWERIEKEEERRNTVVNEKKDKKMKSAGKTKDIEGGSEGNDRGLDDVEAMFWGESAIGWDMVTPIKRDVRPPRPEDTSPPQSPPLLPSTPSPPEVIRNEFTDDPYVAIRKRLAVLTGWDCPGAALADNVCKSMESVLNTLDASGTIVGPDSGKAQTKVYWTWPLVVEINNNPQETHLQITFDRTKMQWIANKQDMEAVLSLWLYALNDVGSEVQEKEMVFLFGPSDASYLRDLCWWVGETANPIQEMVALNGPAAAANEGNAPLDDRAYFGYCGRDIFQEPLCSLLTKLQLQKLELVLDKEAIDRYNYPGVASPKKVLALRTSKSAAEMCCMHLFWSFMLGLGTDIDFEKTLGKIEEQTTLKYHGSYYQKSEASDRDRDVLLYGIETTPIPWYHIKLHNPILSRLAERVQQVGIYTLEEAQLMIVLGLGVKEKMPKAKAVIQWARDQAIAYIQKSAYFQAADITFWLSQACSTFGWEHESTIEALATVSELLRLTNNSWARAYSYKHATLPELDKVIYDSGRTDVLLRPRERLLARTLNRLSMIIAHAEIGGGRLAARMRLLKRVSSFDGRLHKWYATAASPHATEGADRYGIRVLRVPEVRIFTDWDPCGVQYTDDEVHGDGQADASHESSWMSGWHELTIQLLGDGEAELDSKRNRRYAQIFSEISMPGNPSRILQPDPLGRTLLHYVCTEPAVSIDAIMQCGLGLDVNAHDASGLTPLHVAALCHNIEAANDLLRAGAAASPRNAEGQTPLHFAAGAAGFGALLADRRFRDGMVRREHDDHGNPLPVAPAASVLELLLLQTGVDADALDNARYTPLHLAARSGTSLAIHALLKAGAAGLARAEDGCTPIHLFALRSDLLAGAVPWAAVGDAIDVGEDEHYQAGGLSPAALQARSGPAAALVWAAAGAAEGGRWILGLGYQTDGTFQRLQHTVTRAAAVAGNRSLLAALLQAVHLRGPCPDTTTPEDRCNIDGEADRNRVAVPVFAWAAAAGHREVVELLFDGFQASVCVLTDGHFRDILAMAAWGGHEAVMESLLKHRAFRRNVYFPSEIAWKHDFISDTERSVHGYGGAGVGQPPLVIAAARGHVGVVRLLLDCGFRELGTLAVGASQALAAAMWQAQTVAATRGHLGVFKILLTHPSIELLKSWMGDSLQILTAAAEKGHIEVVRALLAHRGIGLQHQVAMYRAATASGDNAVVRAVLAIPGFIKVHPWQAIEDAVVAGHTEVVRAILTHPNITIHRTQVIERAAHAGQVEVVKLLATHQSEESVGISAALWDAASAGHAEVVRVLLDHRTDQKSESDKVLGVLHACKNGHPQVVSVLLAYPSLHWWDDDSFQSQSKVWTPIRVAMYNGHREIIKLLMEFEANCTRPATFESTHEASSSATSVTTLEASSSTTSVSTHETSSSTTSVEASFSSRAPSQVVTME